MITARGINTPARIGPPAVRAYGVSRPVGTAILTSYGISHECRCLGKGSDHGPRRRLEPLAPALPWLFCLVTSGEYGPCSHLWKARPVASGTLPGISIAERDGPDTAAMVDRLTWIWLQENPDGPAGVRKELAGELIRRRGFRCITASSDGNVIGYVYGLYEGQGAGLSGQGRTASIGSHDLIDEWKDTEKSPGVPLVDPAWGDAYDIAEVQVLAEYRHRGIADALIRRLCSRLPADDRVVLTVDWRNVGAQSLYQQIGFRDLIGRPISSRIVPGPGQILMGLEHAGDACGGPGE